MNHAAVESQDLREGATESMESTCNLMADASRANRLLTRMHELARDKFANQALGGKGGCG